MNNSIISQRHFMYNYNKKYKTDFNEELFKRSENQIIDSLKKVIISCQREQNFTLKVISFNVIRDYDTIHKILYDYEEGIKKGKNANKLNPYEYINLKDTDMCILEVKYFIEAKGKCCYYTNYIGVPLIVDRYYFRINGNLYYAVYQITDGSTFNNATSSNTKKDTVTLKTIFGGIKMYRNNLSIEYDKEQILPICNYTVNSFSKTFSVFKYILARFGFYGTLQFMGYKNYIYITKQKVEDDSILSFSKGDFFINVPRYIYENDLSIQSFIYTILVDKIITKYEEVFFTRNWLTSLGSEFTKYNKNKKVKNAPYQQGLSILYSMECNYDLITKGDICLPEDQKKNMYDILKWMIREFVALNNKDNLNLLAKKVKFEDYIASLYSMKLANQLFSFSDQGRCIDINSIKTGLHAIKPTFLLEEITRCNLVNFRNLVNDLDAITALKFSQKGLSGIGNKNRNSVPDVFRMVHYSQMGIVDMDSSSKSDPGLTGILCPYVELHDNNFFSEYKEPNNWETRFNQLTIEYKKLVGKKEICIMQKEFLGKDTDIQLRNIEEDITQYKGLMKIIKKVEDEAELQSLLVQIDEGGNLFYGQE